MVKIFTIVKNKLVVTREQKYREQILRKDSIRIDSIRFCLRSDTLSNRFYRQEFSENVSQARLRTIRHSVAMIEIDWREFKDIIASAIY